jgi:hypothetical protein
VSIETINGGPTLLFWTGGRLYMVSSFRITDGQIQEIYGMLNPDKLAYRQCQLQERERTYSAAP